MSPARAVTSLLMTMRGPARPRVAAFDAVWRGGLLLFALQFANVLFAYLLQIMLARWLGANQFGVFAYVWAWATLLAVPAGLGLSTAVLRFLPAYAADGDWARVRTLVRWSSRTVFTAGLCVCALSTAVVYLLRVHISAQYLLPLCAAFALIPWFALSTLWINYGHAVGRPAAGYLPWLIGSNLGVFAGVLLLLGTGVQLHAVSVLCIAVLALIGVVMVQRRALHALLPSALTRASAQPRQWLRVSAPLLLSSLLYVLLERADVVLVGSLLGARQAGIYGAASRTALLVSFGVIAVTSLATPRIAAMQRNGESAGLQALTHAVARWTFWPALAAALLLIPLGGYVLSLFGPAFREGWLCLAILAAAQVAPASVGLAPHLINMTGHELAGAGVMLAAVLINVTLAILLIPRLGMTGAALATAGALVARAAAHAALAQYHLGIVTLPQFAPESRQP